MDFGNNIESIEKTITKYLRGKGEILFAYIFGSLAKKTSNRLSDIDIAIYIDDKKIDNSKFRYGYQAEVMTDLIGLLKTRKVDLVILNSAPPLLKHRVIYFGELIYSIDEKERIRFQVDTINRYIDYKMLQRKTLAKPKVVA
jgi:uncharacterized protein